METVAWSVFFSVRRIGLVRTDIRSLTVPLSATGGSGSTGGGSATGVQSDCMAVFICRWRRSPTLSSAKSISLNSPNRPTTPVHQAPPFWRSC